MTAATRNWRRRNCFHGCAGSPAGHLAPDSVLAVGEYSAIEKGPEQKPGTSSDLDLLVGTAGFELATP